VTSVHEYLPESKDDVVNLPVDDLALRLLRLLADERNASFLNRHNVANPPSWADHFGYVSPDFSRALLEAWDWLEHRDLLGRETSGEWGFVTRLGRMALEGDDPAALIRATHRLAMELHPIIERRVRRQSCWGSTNKRHWSR
jgi:hypothetical protein